MIEFDSRLFMGTANWNGGGGVYTFGSGGWKSISAPGFGEEANTIVASLVTFRGELYAGTKNMEGFQVWRHEGGSSWTRVAGGTSGNPEYNMVSGMAVCDYGGGELLFATVNSHEGCGVWSYDGSSWTQLVGQDPAGTPGTGPGFGDKDNIGALPASYLGRIYAGTGKG